MRRGVYVVVALVFGAVLANALLRDNGYVAINFLGYLVEMSVPTFVLSIVLSLAVLEALLRLWRWPRRAAAARRERQRLRARSDLDRGLLEMSAGHWAESEATLTRAAREASSPAVHYLAAARAADLQGAVERRNAWLDLATEASAEDPSPALITTAEMRLKSGDTDAALAALTALERRGNDHPRALLLLARVHRQRGDFDRLRQLEPRLRAARGVPATAVDEIMDALYMDMLRVATEKGGVTALDSVWDEATRAARRRPPIAIAYARGLARFGEPARATAALRELLDATWNETAVLLFGELDADPFDGLRVAEAWLKSRREDPALLLTCARLCLRAELIGKARSYLESSHALRPRPETAQLLGELLEKLGERDRALRLLHEGLVLATGRRADLPPLRHRRLGVPRP